MTITMRKYPTIKNEDAIKFIDKSKLHSPRHKIDQQIKEIETKYNIDIIWDFYFSAINNEGDEIANAFTLEELIEQIEEDIKWQSEMNLDL
jgi:hypothetical protein